MNTEEKKVKMTLMKRYTSIGSLIGLIVGSLFIYFFKGFFPYEVVAGGLTALIIFIIVDFIKYRHNKSILPEYDERIVHNLFRYIAYVSVLTLAAIFLTLVIFSLTNNESIPLSYLWIYFFLYIWISAIGMLIVKRR